MISWVCLDSGIVLKLVLREDDSLLAKQLWETLANTDRQPVAPRVFSFEFTSVLRKNVYRGVITPEYGLAALQYLMRLDVKILTIPDIHVNAWQFAEQFNRPAAYDAHYLAMAEHLGCEFWTADKRLYNAVHEELSWVRWLGNFSD